MYVKKNQFLCNFRWQFLWLSQLPTLSLSYSLVTLQLVRLSHHQIKIRIVINGGTYGWVVVCKLFMCHFSVDDATLFEVTQKLVKDLLFGHFATLVLGMTSDGVDISKWSECLEWNFIYWSFTTHFKSSNVINPSAVLSNFLNAWSTIFLRDCDMDGYVKKKRNIWLINKLALMSNLLEQSINTRIATKNSVMSMPPLPSLSNLCIGVKEGVYCIEM